MWSNSIEKAPHPLIYFYQEAGKMSIKSAMDFIQKIGDDDRLKHEIQVTDKSNGLEAIVKIGEQSGLFFTMDELRAAFAGDWRIRQRFYQNRNVR